MDSQLSLLNLETMPEQNPGRRERRRRAAFHEAGHIVAARVFGLRIRNAYLVFAETAIGGQCFIQRPTEMSDEDGLLVGLVQGMAGPMAHWLCTRNALAPVDPSFVRELLDTPGEIKGGACGDTFDIETELDRLRYRSDPEARLWLLTEIACIAARLLQEHWRAVETLANALNAQEALEGADIYLLIDDGLSANATGTACVLAEARTAILGELRRGRVPRGVRFEPAVSGNLKRQMRRLRSGRQQKRREQFLKRQAGQAP